MKTISIPEKNIKGISIRTQNANEMNPETAKIASLYERFDKNIVVNYKNGAHVYGIYYDYESDANGMFSVLAGSDQIESSKENLEGVTIKAGNYLVFEGKGEMPQAVIDTWVKIWTFFADEQTEYKRAYKTDFELYQSESLVQIHIGILNTITKLNPVIKNKANNNG